jgi:hypothetical protein
LSALGYFTDEPYTFNLQENATSFDKTHEYLDNFSYIPIIIIIIALLIIISALLRIKYVRDNKRKQENERKKEKKNKKPTLLGKVNKKLKEKPLLDLIVTLDKSLNEPEQEIIKELKTEGFKDQEITNALKKVDNYLKKYSHPKDEKNTTQNQQTNKKDEDTKQDKPNIDDKEKDANKKDNQETKETK